MRKACNYLSNLICITLLAWIPREFSNVTAAGFLSLISYLFLLLLFLPSWAFFLVYVWFIPSSYLYKEQIYWGMGYHHELLGLPCQPGTNHVISCERERVPWVMTSLSPSALHLHWALYADQLWTMRNTSGPHAQMLWAATTPVVSRSEAK